MLNLKEARNKAGYTQKKLAEVVGTHREYISNLENDHKEPSLKMLNRLAKALNTTVKALIKDSA